MCHWECVIVHMNVLTPIFTSIFPSKAFGERSDAKSIKSRVTAVRIVHVVTIGEAYLTPPN